MLYFTDHLKKSKNLKTVLIVVAIGLVVLASMWGGRILTTSAGGVSVLAILMLQKARRIAGGVIAAIVRSTPLVVGPLLKVYLDVNEHVRNAIAEKAAAMMGQPLPDIFRESSTQAAFFFAAGMVALAFIEAYRKHPAAGTRTSADPELRSQQYRKDLLAFCQNLASDLYNINNDTHWSSNYFEPLEAEVEIMRQGPRTRRLTDLVSAIRHNHTSKLFVVLGDPGSGKSVSLRLLCEQMLKEVEASGRVPLYLNLKEWSPKTPWSQKNPPRLSELQDFVLANLKPRLGHFGSDFLDSHYKRMLQEGELFVVFDSFDEIPAVLDVDDSSWLIEALSSVFEHFFWGGTESRGIIASRYFRRPRLARQQDICTLEIRPFSERKIAQSFGRHGRVSETAVSELLQTRHDLIPLARNPFTAGLIIDYLQQPDHKLPHTKSEIYQSYIAHRLNAATEQMEEYHLTTGQVIASAVAIAGHMFTSKDIGLEISIPVLEAALPDQNIPDAIEVLVSARIGRRSGSTKGRFSFVHRRFNEYFFVQYLLQSGGVRELNAIPTDSKWRDALVLYSEVCSDEAAKHIAGYCWGEIQRTSQAMGDDARNYVRHVHCLRFLSDAFHGRQAPLAEFQVDLFQHILTAVEGGRDILTKIIAVEAAGLLRTNHLRYVVVKALGLNVPWISETAFNACRYIPQLPKAVKFRLKRFLGRFDTVSFISRYRELQFALQLSPAMKSLRSYWYLRVVDICAFTVAYCALLVIKPLQTAFCTLAVLGFLRAMDLLIGPQRRTRYTTRHYHGDLFQNLGFRGMLGGTYFYFSFLGSLSTTGLPLLALRSEVDYENYVAAVLNYEIGSPARQVLVNLLLPLLLFPVHKLDYLVPYVLRDNRRIRKLFMSLLRYLRKSWRFVIGMILGTMVGGALLVGAVALAVRYPILADIFIAAICIAPATFLAVLVRNSYRYVCSRIADRRTASALSELPTTRSEIEAHLDAFQLSRSRKRYVLHLQMEGVKPTGEWSQASLPSYGDVEVDTLLARLEARWLGVDR